MEAFNLMLLTIIIFQFLCQVAGTAITSLFILFLWTNRLKIMVTPVISDQRYIGHIQPMVIYDHRSDFLLSAIATVRARRRWILSVITPSGLGSAARISA